MCLEICISNSSYILQIRIIANLTINALSLQELDYLIFQAYFVVFNLKNLNCTKTGRLRIKRKPCNILQLSAGLAVEVPLLIFSAFLLLFKCASRRPRGGLGLSLFVCCVCLPWPQDALPPPPLHSVTGIGVTII